MHFDKAVVALEGDKPDRSGDVVRKPRKSGAVEYTCGWMYDTKAIANYFLGEAEKSGKKIDPMQLQKLVYFAHGWHLALHDKPLIDDTVQAWRYGPVIPILYHEFKYFGKTPITRRATNVSFPDGDEGFSNLLFIEPALSREEMEQEGRLLNLIWQTYGKLTGVQLSNLTHAPDTPWYITWQKADGRKSVTIPDDLIRDYFKSKLNA